MAIDGKLFNMYLNGKERIRAAMHATYGAYRQPGKGLNKAYVKPKGKLHHNTGAKGCLIQAAVGNGRVMMWQSSRGPLHRRVEDSAASELPQQVQPCGPRGQ